MAAFPSLIALLLLSFCLNAFCGLLPTVGRPLGALETVSESSNAGRCQYIVEIRTSCKPFSGTDDPISLVFGDGYGNQVYIPRLNDPSKDLFEMCHIDTFTILGPCVYDVCYLYLYRSGTDSWRPSYVTIYYDYDSSAYFKFDTGVPSDVWFGFDRCKVVREVKSLSAAI